MKRLSDEELAELDGYVRGVVFFGSKDPLRHIPGILAEVLELRAFKVRVGRVKACQVCLGTGAETDIDSFNRVVVLAPCVECRGLP